MSPDLERKRPARIAIAAAIAAFTLLPLASPAAEPAKVTFSESEIKRILSHGPWPVPAKADASNRASGQADAIVLGTAIFFDPRLSASGQMACSSCHVPERNWTDNLTRGVGKVEVDRNTPSLMNLRTARWFGWDGAADSLWSQNLRPMLDRRELASTPHHVAELVRKDALLSCRYAKAFGTPPSTDDESVLVGVGKAIASFLETLVSGRTPFDRFRDALAKGEPRSSWNFSEPALRGLKIFIGKGDCTNCHSGPNFTGGEFFNTGLSKFEPQGRPDAGREAGIKHVLASRFNLLGPHNDDKSGANTEHLRKAAKEKPMPGEFKVPSLRNLLLTAPYGRDGRVETVAEVVKHYAGLDPVRLREKGAKDSRHSKPLNLTEREQTDLVVFLETLSTFSNPWRPEDNGRCD
jgi:cytochrome c peroxidase